jgi:hypothetical protein
MVVQVQVLSFLQDPREIITRDKINKALIFMFAGFGVPKYSKRGDSSPRRPKKALRMNCKGLILGELWAVQPDHLFPFMAELV